MNFINRAILHVRAHAFNHSTAYARLALYRGKPGQMATALSHIANKTFARTGNYETLHHPGNAWHPRDRYYGLLEDRLIKILTSNPTHYHPCSPQIPENAAEDTAL
ncbi:MULTISPECIES: hypothetical protein [unclassified Burkholderia]|uniref:hypothetical protein n=1 Tax=unclassified Burkholderia TaxID=2613784 RepID=UPI000B008294|nr:MULTISPECIES: hypothetical protein [unclassified Burkholderia]